MLNIARVWYERIAGAICGAVDHTSRCMVSGDLVTPARNCIVACAIHFEFPSYDCCVWEPIPHSGDDLWSGPKFDPEGGNLRRDFACGNGLDIASG